MTQPVSTRIHVQPDPMQAYMYSLCHALDVQISLSPTVSVRVTAAAAATIAAPVTLRSEKRVRMCVNTLRRTKKRMLTQSGTQQRCARPRGVCRPKQQGNQPSATCILSRCHLTLPCHVTVCCTIVMTGLQTISKAHPPAHPPAHVCIRVAGPHAAAGCPLVGSCQV
jgi:hypothetical protein